MKSTVHIAHRSRQSPQRRHEKPVLQAGGNPRQLRERVRKSFAHAAPADIAQLLSDSGNRTLGQMLKTAHTPDAGAIHDLRVQLRRFIETVHIASLAGSLPGPELRVVLARLRTIRRLGGKIRDLDVQAAWARKVRPGQAEADPVFPMTRAKFRDSRQSMIHTLGRRLNTCIVTNFSSRGLPGAAPARRDAAARLSATESVLRRIVHNIDVLHRRCGRALKTRRDHPVHRARIAAKKLRYSCEIAARSGTPGMAPIISRLKQFQTLTGDLHDACLLREHCLQYAAASHQLPTMEALHRRLHKQAMAAVQRIHRWTAE